MNLVDEFQRTRRECDEEEEEEEVVTSPEAKGFYTRSVVVRADGRRRGHRRSLAGDDSRGNVAMEFYDARN